jgi:hypothetical protein
VPRSRWRDSIPYVPVPDVGGGINRWTRRRMRRGCSDMAKILYRPTPGWMPAAESRSYPSQLSFPNCELLRPTRFALRVSLHPPPIEYSISLHRQTHSVITHESRSTQRVSPLWYATRRRRCASKPLVIVTRQDAYDHRMSILSV